MRRQQARRPADTEADEGEPRFTGKVPMALHRDAGRACCGALRAAAGVPQARRRPIRYDLIGVHPRSSAAEYPCLLTWPARQRQAGRKNLEPRMNADKAASKLECAGAPRFHDGVGRLPARWLALRFEYQQSVESGRKAPGPVRMGRDTRDSYCRESARRWRRDACYTAALCGTLAPSAVVSRGHQRTRLSKVIPSRVAPTGALDTSFCHWRSDCGRLIVRHRFELRGVHDAATDHCFRSSRLADIRAYAPKGPPP